MVELLVVMVILGILAGVGIPTLLNQQRRARVAEARSALSAVSRGSEIYRLDEGDYPCTGFNLIDGGGANGNAYMDQTYADLAPNYNDPLPDPGCDEEGILWTSIARNTSPAYVNGIGVPLTCKIGLGDQTLALEDIQLCNI